MRKRWSVILPIYGLVLFGGRYFWWGTLRLDPDPLNRYLPPAHREACADNEPNCVAWDPQTIWVEPGAWQKLLILTALPAFIAVILPMLITTKLGISQILVFFISVPICLSAWFYFLGCLIDRCAINEICRY